jgi:hypothetical protein
MDRRTDASVDRKCRWTDPTLSLPEGAMAQNFKEPRDCTIDYLNRANNTFNESESEMTGMRSKDSQAVDSRSKEM